MPIYDFECRTCGHVMEVIAPVDCCDRPRRCVKCDNVAYRIITASGVFLGNEESSAWIKSVLEVVDKDSKAPHVRNFLKDPTRRNYRAWMKGEGLRPLERGESPKPPPTNTDRLAQKMYEAHRKRKRIEIG